MAPIGATSQSTVREDASREALLRYGSSVLDLRSRVGNLAAGDWFRGADSLESGSVALESKLDLDLDKAATSTRIESTQALRTPTRGGQVSASDTQFGGTSTAEVSVGGEYDGALGDDVQLTLEVTKSGVVGEAPTTVTAFDGSGQEVATVTLDRDYEPGEEVDLVSGVTIALEDGLAVKGGSVTVDLTAPEPVGKQLTGDSVLGSSLGTSSGSLEIQGVKIQVNEEDTLNQLLERINSEVRDVKASFNEVSGTVVLQRATGGPLALELGDDSSGFLKAAHLADAPTRRGTDSARDTVLAKLDAFAEVQSGRIRVNDRWVEVDVEEDTLDDVLARIETADPTVQASYSTTSDRVTLASFSGSLQLADEKTGLFSALGIREGDHEAEQVESQRSVQVLDRSALQRELVQLGEVLSGLFAFEASGLAGARADAARELLRGTVEEVLKDNGADFAEGRLRTDYGLKLDLDRASGPVMRFDEGQLEQALLEDPSVLHGLLMGGDGEGSSEGLIERLVRSADSLFRGLEGTGHGPRALDVTA